MGMNDNQQIDAATACKRYRESMTPMVLHRFERNFMAVFGATPPRAVPAEEAKRIYEQTLVECGT